MRRRFRSCSLTTAAAVLASVVVTPRVLESQDGLAQAEALMAVARSEGNRFLQSKDGKAKDQTAKALKDAEKLLRDLLKSNPSCEKCEEELVSALFVRSIVGLS